VIRDLDGAVVRKYTVKAEPIWKQPVEVQTEGGPDVALNTLVQGQNATLRFLLFLVGPDREIHQIYRFKVRRNAPGGAPTSAKHGLEPGKGYAYLTAGKLEGIEGDEVLVSPWQGGDVSKLVSNNNTTVSDSGGKLGAWEWPQAKPFLKVGNQVTIVYTEHPGRSFGVLVLDEKEIVGRRGLRGDPTSFDLYESAWRTATRVRIPLRACHARTYTPRRS
jgi:hypothetical protein